MENSYQSQNIIGYRFKPTGKELALYYLKRKLEGEWIPPGSIHDIDIYGNKNPWEIFDKDSDEYNYVFARLKKKKNDHHRILRTAGCGTWNARQNKKRKFDDDDDNDVDDDNDGSWVQKDFLFQVKSKSSSSDDDVNGHWIMMEISLPQLSSDYVVCRIYNKNATGKAMGCVLQEPNFSIVSDGTAIDQPSCYTCPPSNNYLEEPNCRTLSYGAHSISEPQEPNYYTTPAISISAVQGPSVSYGAAHSISEPQERIYYTSAPAASISAVQGPSVSAVEEEEALNYTSLLMSPSLSLQQFTSIFC